MPDNYTKATSLTPSDNSNQYFDGIYVGSAAGSTTSVVNTDLKVSMYSSRSEGQATSKVTFQGTSAGIDNKWLQIVSTDGESKYYWFDTNGSSAETGNTVFGGDSQDWILVGLADAGTTALVAAEFGEAIGGSKGHASITATVAGGIVSLTQVRGGHQGNTTITGGMGPGQTGTIIVDFGATIGFSAGTGITIVDQAALVKHYGATGGSWSDGAGSAVFKTFLQPTLVFGAQTGGGASAMYDAAFDLKTQIESTSGHNGSIDVTLTGTGPNVLLTLTTTVAGAIGTAITEDLANVTLGGSTQWDKAEGSDLSGVCAGGSWGARGASWEAFVYGEAGVCMEFGNVPTGYQPIKVCRVWDTGTSAINIVGFDKFGV